MAYTRTTWQNGVTPLNAANMNNIEDGIQEALAGGGGGASIGGGHTIRTNWPGAASSSKFLVFGKRADNGMFGLIDYSETGYKPAGYDDPIFYNVSFIVPLDWDSSSFSIDPYSALVGYDGVPLTQSNKTNYLNKICYLISDCTFNEED